MLLVVLRQPFRQSMCVSPGGAVQHGGAVVLLTVGNLDGRDLVSDGNHNTVAAFICI